MENIIQKHRAFVAGQIEKSFSNEFQVPNQEVEKAYNVGDEKDFNGRTYYVHGLNAKGQPLWRLKSKKTKSDNEKKFKEDFKDASDDVLQKIVEGKIQAGDQEKKWATDIINERKKSGKSEAAAKKIIDLLTVSSSRYTDIKKVVAFKADKGNWAIDYDGANTGIILNGSKLSERELKAAGVKIEGVSTKTDPRDKIAQDAGFKDYAEMKGFQEYVTTKSLLKKPSMQAKTKQAEREALEKRVADYEKNHADVIAARSGKKSVEKKGAKSDHKDEVIQNADSITLKITTNGSGVIKLSDSVNAKWQDVKDEDFGGRIIGIKIDGKLGAKTFPYSFDSMKRKKYGLYTFEEAKSEAEKYLNNKKSELAQQA